MILCLGRTGSSHLVDLLDSHPRARCFAEVLSEAHPEAPPEGWIGAAGTADAAVHLDRLLAGPEADAVGFKLPPNSLRDHPEAAGWLAGNPGVRVVRLRRRNLLALLVSRRLVRATLVSQSIYGSYRDSRVELEADRCARVLERIEAEEAELDELTSGHPVFGITYEELVAGERLADLQAFLGLEPAPLRSRYERLRTRPLGETIANWEEVRDALAGTRFEPMLADG